MNQQNHAKFKANVTSSLKMFPPLDITVDSVMIDNVSFVYIASNLVVRLEQNRLYMSHKKKSKILRNQNSQFQKNKHWVLLKHARDCLQNLNSAKIMILTFSGIFFI